MVTNEFGEVLDPRENLSYYTLQEIRTNPIWTPDAIRTEYQRLRKIALKRLATMEKYKEGRSSRTYKANIGKYKPYSELKPGEVKVLLADVSAMLAAKRGTLQGIRKANKQAIETLKERGYEFITAGNIAEFGKFMEAWRASSHRGYGSIYATDLWAAAIKKKVEPGEVERKFNDWRAQMGKVSPATGEPSADDLLERFGDYLGG